MSVFTAERVKLDLSREDYEHLLFVLGFAAATMFEQAENERALSIIKLADTLNEGNPNWTPYTAKEGGAR